MNHMTLDKSLVKISQASSYEDLDEAFLIFSGYEYESINQHLLPSAAKIGTGGKAIRSFIFSALAEVSSRESFKPYKVCILYEEIRAIKDIAVFWYVVHTYCRNGAQFAARVVFDDITDTVENITRECHFLGTIGEKLKKALQELEVPYTLKDAENIVSRSYFGFKTEEYSPVGIRESLDYALLDLHSTDLIIKDF